MPQVAFLPGSGRFCGTAGPILAGPQPQPSAEMPPPTSTDIAGEFAAIARPMVSAARGRPSRRPDGAAGGSSRPGPLIFVVPPPRMACAGNVWGGCGSVACGMWRADLT